MADVDVRSGLPDRDSLLFVTGLLSYASCNPGLSPLNDETPDKGVLGFYLFSRPTQPYWLYRLLQAVRVTLGVVLVPVLLAKSWSVIPKRFEWLPMRSVAHALERLSLLRLHFYGASVCIDAFVVHVSFRLRRMTRALRPHSLAAELRTDLAHTVPELPDPDGLVAGSALPPTMTRRGAVGTVGAGSRLLPVVTAGQSIGGLMRGTALLAPHNRDPDRGPNGFQINKTAAKVGVTPALVGPSWRLKVHGRGAPPPACRSRGHGRHAGRRKCPGRIHPTAGARSPGSC
ncbi:hypothetical protein AB0I54_38755 [Streptomyces sp. NPDC050625]|uniref:hypothetical protein n=1 Tax=Streptomyces sp. NPDC050625 TaxID=3154629 RepID=UPI0034356E0A